MAVPCAVAALLHAEVAVPCAVAALLHALFAVDCALVPQLAAHAICVAAVPPIILIAPFIVNVHESQVKLLFPAPAKKKHPPLFI